MTTFLLAYAGLITLLLLVSLECHWRHQVELRKVATQLRHLVAENRRAPNKRSA